MIGAIPSLSSGYARNAAESAYPGLWDRLVGAWPFWLQRGATIVEDFSGRGFNGAQVNSANEILAGGRYGRAFYGDPASAGHNPATNYINLGTASPLGGVPLSVTFGCRALRVGGLAEFDAFVGKSSSTDWVDGWGFYVEGANIKWFMGVYNVGRVAASVSLTDRYYSVTGTCDGTTIKIYVDGYTSASATPSLAVSALTAPLLLSRLGGTASGYNVSAAFDYLYIHKRILSPSEISFIHRQPYLLFSKRENRVRGFIAYSETLDAGSYSVTGASAGTLATGREVISSSSYSISGSASGAGIKESANPASYAVSGTDMVPLAHKLDIAASGGYVLSGTDSTAGASVESASGTHTITGAAIIPAVGVQGESSSFDINGVLLTSLLHAYEHIENDSYSLAGSDAIGVAGAEISPGSYGQDADDIFDVIGIENEAGIYEDIGEDIVSLYHSGLLLDEGSYSKDGEDVVFDDMADLSLVGSPEAYDLLGEAAEFAGAYGIDAGAGSYALTGADASGVYHTFLLAEFAVYAVTGDASEFLRGYLLGMDANVYSLSGTDTTSFLIHYIEQLSTDTYSIDGTLLEGIRGVPIEADAGEYALSGVVMEGRGACLAGSASGIYALVGMDAGLLESIVDIPRFIRLGTASLTAKSSTAVGSIAARGSGPGNLSAE